MQQPLVRLDFKIGSLGILRPRIYRTEQAFSALPTRMDYKLAKPGFWMSALLTLMAVMVQTVISLPLGILDEVFKNMRKPAPELANEPFVIGVVNLIAFGVAISVGLILNQMPPGRAFPLRRPTAMQFLGMVLTVLGADILLSEADNLFRSVATPPDWVMEAYKVLLSPEAGLAGRIFLLVIVAPLTEELLFRGVILRGLLARFPAWVAVGLAALLFAAGHVNPWQFISAFWIGIAFGWFYIRTRSLALCILGHAVSNGLFVLFTCSLFDIPGLTGGPDATEVAFQPWWLDLSAAVVLALGILSFIRATPARECVSPAEPPVIPPPLPGESMTQSLPPVITPPPG